jgi:hypothetical protein
MLTATFLESEEQHWVVAASMLLLFLEIYKSYLCREHDTVRHPLWVRLSQL